jgi:glutamate carboxypeptidase
MKAGVTATLKIQEFISRGWIRPNRKVRFLYTTDEETGSDASRELIEEFSRESDLVLVTEPPLHGGILKTFRKGCGMAAMRIHGRAAHAGVEPERGVNAVRELGHQIEAIHGLASSRLETSVHVTMAEGGTRDNVIPEFAKATIDFRFRTVEEGHRVEDALHALKPAHPEIRLEVTGGINRPPMIKGEGGQQLFDQAREIGAELGLDLEEGETGGGSDGSYSAALGVPTLDGLGVDGDGAHALHEHIELDALPVRAALLARLVEKL